MPSSPERNLPTAIAASDHAFGRPRHGGLRRSYTRPIVIRPARLLWALLFALFLVWVMPAAALAQGESVRGTLTITVEGEREPVAGVVIIVSQDGSEVGVTESDDTGAWEVEVPGPGIYAVRLDTSTLPDGVALTDPDKDELPAIQVRAGTRQAVVFPLGEGAVGTPLYERAGALFIAGLKLGAIIALAAIGLSLIYGVTGLVNFAQGEMVTLGAVVAYFFHVSTAGPGWSLLLAAIPAILVGAAFGWAQDRGLWRPLRKRGMGLVSMMVVSIGLSFAVRYVILVVFSGQRRLFSDFTGQAPIEVLGIPMVPKHLFTIAAAVIILVGVGLFLQKTKMGTALRAVADDVDLAESSGINVDRVITLTWVLAGALAAIAGVFFGANEAIQWDMGFRLLLLIFAAVVLGGIGTAYGAMVGGFIVGVTVEMSTLIFPNELKTAVGLALLVVMLLFRPQGILGSKERIG